MFRKVLMLVAVLMMIATPLFASLGQSDLDQVVAKLNQVAGRSFSVEVDYSQDLNAWARSDGQLGVTQGMLNALATPDQLAFVVGHEMTHVIRGHHNEQFKQVLLGALLGALAGKVIGDDGDDARLGAELGAGILGGKESRGDEYEADAEALMLAHKAGYSPNGGIETLQLLQSRYGNGPAGIPVIGWFASHPSTGNRVAALQKIAATLAPVQPVQPVQLSNLGLMNQILNLDGGFLTSRATPSGMFTSPGQPISLEIIGGGR